MQTKSYRLDRFMSKQLGINRRDIKLMLAQGRIIINAKVVRDVAIKVEEFDRVEFDGKPLQDKQPVYIMMNKPLGVVSATKDQQHKTVVDLLSEDLKQINGGCHDLHIVGRLDLNTSGLLLLTNDGRWSRQLMNPEKKVKKIYRVTLKNDLTEEYVSAFAKGMYFSFEKIITQPAQLTILSKKIAQVVLTEGKYHQIKRMFGRFRNPVLALHRCKVGELILDEALLPGESRALTTEEVTGIFNHTEHAFKNDSR